MTEDTLDTFKRVYFENPSVAKDRGRTTEADTRANVLDRIIHEVLKWPRSCVKREPFANPGYIDYEFTHGRKILLMEAKAQGESFILPYQKQPKRRLKISGTLTADKKVSEAINQVQRYCSDTGTRFGVATNGFAFVIFRAIVDGASWKDGIAIVFYDYNDVVSNFTEFWNLLSYEAVKDGKLDTAFRLSPVHVRSFYRPIDQIVDADATYGRNPFNAALKPFVEQFFGDIAAQTAIDILKHCYVYSRPIQIIDKDLKLAIKDNIPQFATQTKQISTDPDSENGEVGYDIRNGVTSRPSGGSVILIMGGIGSGKSTFCKRFFRVVSPDIVSEDGPAMLVYLDFLGASDNLEQLYAVLWDKAVTSILNSEPKFRKKPYLLEIFSEDIKTIRHILESSKRTENIVNEKVLEWFQDKKKFTEAALRYAAQKTRMPIVVFDNVDQLRFEAQTQLFTEAYRFANSFGCYVILVLREESYSAALMKKHLTAYTIRPYHLSSPKFSRLLALRIDFAVNEAARKAKDETAEQKDKLYAGITSLFNLLRLSVLQKNRNIIRLVESIAYGNMRLALDLFNSFISSGATDIPKILNKYKTSGGYTVPFHEFIKSVMLGDYRYYKESRSLILNAFHVTNEQNASHFTALRILKYLHDRGSGEDRSEDFVSLQTLLTDHVDIFNNESDCRATLLRLIAIDRQLVELDTRRPDTLEGATSARITTSGKYYLEFMINSFQYCDIVWHDTSFLTRSTCDELSRLMNERDMAKRFVRVDKFLDYLEHEEANELTAYGLTVQTPSFCGPFLPRIKEFCENEKKLIQKKHPI